MVNYKKMYTQLFNRVTDVIEELQEIQRQVEELYLKDQTAEVISITEENKTNSSNF